ncbi:hypothetical protein HMI48_01695 [Acidithiobacillus ferrooxidans]|uniref:hypothetical protein n=1 Tax=Acidithiobacillus ferrooxidans TaxID=920 RepID=UPI001C070E69|nr:hypothetical protein [Acidithiobacillus ferrooxidans]MBU2772673.1 hypothetical protein [Acidithiobacillus ferrooxidans]
MSSTNVDIDDIEAWAVDEGQAAGGKSRQRRLTHLIASVEYDRRMPQPNALPVNSGERRIAEARQRRLLSKAVAQGYQPPVKEIATEIGKEAAGHALGVPLDMDPGAMMKDITSREQSVGRKRDIGSSGLGFGFSSGS